METEEKFNPALRDWLNEQDYCSGDWPYDVPLDVLHAGDAKFGNGCKLGEDGYPTPFAIDHSEGS